MNNFFSRLAPAAALCLPLLAFAQTGRTDPADSKGTAPALRHQSAFADYKAWQDFKPGDWRALNDNVRDAAGKGVGNGDQTPPAEAPPAPSAPLPTASAPAAPGHGNRTPGGKP